MSGGKDIKISINVEAKDDASKILEKINNTIEKIEKAQKSIENITSKIDLQDNATNQIDNITRTLNNLDKKVVRPKVELKANEIMDTASGEVMQINGMDKWQQEMASSRGSGGGGAPPDTPEAPSIPEPSTLWYDKAQAASKSMVKTGAAMSLALTAPLVKAGKEVTNLSLNFESAMVGVRKTTDMTDTEFNTMSRSIRDMSKEIPATAEEIAGVAEIAGQLGVPKQELLEYSRAMIDMGESTNLAADVAASSMAQFSAITGLDITAENANRLGSSIVALGNNFQTTEADIMAMGMRLAGTGAQVGLSEAQILGMSAAMSSVGINAEAGGSSFSRVMQKINTSVKSGDKNLKNFAKVAGMTAKDFTAQWESNPQEAIVSFVKGLDEIKNAGGDVASTLKEMGINSSQEIDTLSRLSGAHEMMADAMNQSTTAWGENNALSNEAALRYESNASKLQMMKNQIADAAISIGDALMPTILSVMEIIGNLAEKFQSLSPGVQDFIVKALMIAAIAGPIIGAIGGIIGAVGKVGQVFSTISSAVSGLTGVLGMLNPTFLIIVGVIAAVIAIGVLLYQNWDTIKEKAAALGAKVSEVWNSIKEGVSNVASAIKEGIGAAFDWIGDKVDAVKGWFSDKWGNVKDFFGFGDGEETPEIVDTEAIIQDVETARQTLLDFSAEAPGLIANVTEQMNQLSEPMEQFNQEITTAQETLNTFSTSAQTAITTIITALTNLGIMGPTSFQALTVALTLLSMSFMSNTTVIQTSLMMLTTMIMTFSAIFNASLMSVQASTMMFTMLLTLMFTQAETGFTQLITTATTSMALFQNVILAGATNSITAFETFRSGALGILNSMQGQMYSSGLALMTTLASGISAGAGAVTSAMAGVMAQARAYLPFSDAKVGPLSELTLSGNRLIGTIAQGVIQGSNQLTSAMNQSLGQPQLAGVTSSGGNSNNSSVTVNVEVNITDGEAEAIGEKVKREVIEAIKKAKTNRRK